VDGKQLDESQPNQSSGPSEATAVARSAKTIKLDIKASDRQGLKYFKALKPMLERLHLIGTEPDKASNRDLHMDEYCTLVLLWMFSPILTSLRGLRQASELTKVAKKLGVGRASLGSLSESVSIFDPTALKEIATELSSRIPQPSQKRFDAIGKAGVVSDQIIRFNNASSDKALPDHRVRLVMVAASKHTSRGKSAKKGSSTGPSCDGFLRLVTDMENHPADLIAEGYRLRWIIELFFRMFKQLLGCRHLLSTKQNGVEIQVYCALIACMLILIHSGRNPTKRTFEMISFYMMGWATLTELERHIAKLKAKAN
jgi:hypothetical protein